MNAAALRRCDPKRRSRATFVRFFPLSDFVPLPVLELSHAVVSDSTKFSPRCLPLPHPHRKSPLVRAIRRIAWLESAFNRSKGSFGLAEGLTRQMKRGPRGTARRAKRAANRRFAPRRRCRPARTAGSCRLVQVRSGRASALPASCETSPRGIGANFHRARPQVECLRRRLVIRSPFAATFSPLLVRLIASARDIGVGHLFR